MNLINIQLGKFSFKVSLTKEDERMKSYYERRANRYGRHFKVSEVKLKPEDDCEELYGVDNYHP